jgi:nifR3 family TIM-barrel protein
VTVGALTLGGYEIWPPVVLAPMAGITNIAFRRLCREHGAGLYVCEMVTTRALVERNPKTMRMVAFQPDERPRSLQLYGVDPDVVGRAVRMVVDEDLADHIDLNFGCPVPKVTRKGGGAALPWRWRLFERIVRAAVDAAAPARVPVTVKMRKGIDEDHLTYLRAGRIAEDAGVAAVALHGRTGAQRYSGQADWTAIAALKAHLSVPVLGNGDIWEAEDALRMVAETGVDGVVVGRGCLGRPWLFADLVAAFDAEIDAASAEPGPATRAAAASPQPERRLRRLLPNLGQVAAAMRRHAELLVEWLADADPSAPAGAAERHGCADFRKHVAWYLKGFPVGSELRQRLAMISSLAELDDLLGKLDPAQPYPLETLGQPRGRTTPPGQLALPDGWLADPEADGVPEGAELADSGG